MWHDQWCDAGVLSNIVTKRDIYDTRLQDDICVHDMVVNNNWKWPDDWLDIFPSLSNFSVSNILEDIEHITKWKDMIGNLVEFSTKQAWDVFRLHNVEVIWNKIVWFSQCNPRFAFVLWMAIKWRLQTQDRLMKWNSNQNMKCPLCDLVNDSHNHLFFECDFSKTIWDSLMEKLEERNMPIIWENIIEYFINSPCNNSIGSVMRRVTLATTVYYIWKERNSRLFRGEMQTQEVVLKNIEENIKLQMLSLKIKKSSNVGKNGKEMASDTQL